jgi:hypothetical protein
MEESMSDPRTLSLLVHANSKTGKSTLAATCPFPICFFDAEGGTKFLAGSPSLTARLGRPMVFIEWDPAVAPPVYDGTWDAAVVTVRSWSDMQQAWAWLSQGQHHFQSIVVDSITEVQRRAKANLKGTEAMQIQDWGQLLTIMDTVIRGLRDLTIDPYNPVRVAMFIAETRQIDGKWRPYMQGQIATSLPYWMDVVGYLYVDMEQDGDGQYTIPVRKLLVNQHALYEAGERVQGLVGPVISNPDIHFMLESIYPQQTQVPEEATQ